jgi:hypothetical protein
MWKQIVLGAGGLALGVGFMAACDDDDSTDVVKRKGVSSWSPQNGNGEVLHMRGSAKVA